MKIERGKTFERKLTLDREAMQTNERIVPASLSSEVEVDRYFGKEVLVHNPDAVNLERSPLPLLWGHDHNVSIGIVENVRLENKRLLGNLRFSRNARATEIWNDVQDGFLSNLSISYTIDDFEETNNGLRATRWTPVETSVVTVPADFKVGINRAKEVNPMADDITQDAGGGTKTAENLKIEDFQMYRTRNLEEGRKAGQIAERKRISEIRKIFSADRFQSTVFRDLMDACIDNSVTVDGTRDLLLEMVGYGSAPIIERAASDDALTQNPVYIQAPNSRNTIGTAGRIQAGADKLDKFRAGAEQSLMLQVGNIKDKEELASARGNEFRSMRPSELAREYLRVIDVPVKGMDRAQLIGAALTRSVMGHSTSDFASILENVSNKSLLMGYNETPETWRAWCRTGTLPDFKQGSRPQLSAFGDLDVIYEGGEYKYGTFADHKEVIQLLTYGKMFSITRQALINDDLNALSRIPFAMGRSAARKVGDLAYNILINGITGTLMNEDATYLFHADHTNYIASGSGAAPSMATINAIRTAMAKQTDSSGNAVLNLSPAFWIGPKALEHTASTLRDALYDPAGTAGTLPPNTVRGTFEIVADARLDVDSASKWYMAASPTQVDTVEIAFLDGQETPFLESKDGWNVDGVEYKVRLDAAAAALDFRGLYLNFGS